MTAARSVDVYEKKSAPGLNPWIVLLFMSLPVFVGALDLTVVSAFLPELVIDLELPLQTGLDDASWIVSAYLLAVAIGMTVMGRLSDLVGRRRVYVICLLVFVFGSVLVAVAHLAPTDFLYSVYRRFGERPDRAYVNLQVIIFGRAVQALGAGALVPVTLALAADLFPPHLRARPLGFIGAVDTLGWVLGHLYGGIFVQFFPWQGLFWINVPLMMIALIAVLYALRHIPQTRHQGRFDFIGAELIAGSLICLNLGLGGSVHIPTSGNLEELSTLPPNALPLLLGSFGLFVLFVGVESRVREPLINLKMFRNRGLSAGLVTNLFVGYCLFIGLVIVPILVNIRQTSLDDISSAALQVGILLSALTVPMALATLPGGWLAERIGYRATTIAGLLLAVTGFVLVWRTWTLDIADAIIALEMALVGVGIGLTFSPISASVINVVGEEERGVASTLVIILRLIGMTISVSSLTAFAFSRVNILVAQQLGQVGLDPLQYPDVYAQTTASVLAELGFIGAALCALAIIPAAMLEGRKTASAGVKVASQEWSRSGD